MDAILLAGDRGQSRKVLGADKALLTLDGRPLLLHVLAALDGARSVDRIYIVGPKARIETVLAPFCQRAKRWIVLEQQETLLANALSAYDSARADDARSPVPEADAPPALFVPADIPLITSHEIEAFIARSDMGRADYCIGMTREETLARFYPAADRPGIRMAYLHLEEGAYRMNNLHLVRPRRVGAVDVVQTAYALRHQREVGNTLKTLWDMIGALPWRQGFRLYLLARCAVWFSRWEMTPLVSACRSRLPMEGVEQILSLLLKARVALVETPFGGGALDIDDDAAYETLASRYAEWSRWMRQPDGQIDPVAAPAYPHPFPLGNPSLR